MLSWGCSGFSFLALPPPPLARCLPIHSHWALPCPLPTLRPYSRVSEDQGTQLEFPDSSCQLGTAETALSEQPQVPVELQDVCGVMLKLLFPGQEDVSHLLLALPATKEGTR